MAFWRRISRQMQAATDSVAVAPASPVVERAKSPRSRMMRQYDLVERVRSYNPDTDEDLLNRAYVYAMKAHGSQTRASGDPYFSHPLEVAAILTGLKLDDATIVAALLHDTIEDTEATRAEIDNVFGHEIGALVEGLTKLKRLELVSREAKQAENLRKLLLAIADDVRVLLVKLADRLHNMRTLEFVPHASRRRIAEETLDIYAPLAGRMGMQEMREACGTNSSVRMLCRRSASLIRSTRTSSAIASSSLRRFSACLASRETSSSRFSLVSPSTSAPISWPKMLSISARVASVSSMVSCRRAATMVASVSYTHLTLPTIYSV